MIDSCEIIEHMPFSQKSTIGARAKIGLIVLASDYTIENEFRYVFTLPGIDFYQARIENVNDITPSSLASMETRIPDTLRLILPGEPLDIVAYACTSASMVLGESTVFKRIAEVQPNAHCTTPATAAFAAFNALSAKRIAVLTPYRSDVNKIVRNYIVNAGFDVPVFGSFNEEHDPTVSRIDEPSIGNAIESMVENRDIDMVFVSCTSVRMLKSVAKIERKIGLPVTSSNHAMAWHCLRLSGVSQSMPNLGQLYCRTLP